MIVTWGSLFINSRITEGKNLNERGITVNVDLAFEKLVAKVVWNFSYFICRNCVSVVLSFGETFVFVMYYLNIKIANIVFGVAIS